MKTPKLTILVGCPASGKSTYAEWVVKTEPRTMRISRDEIRFSQFQEMLDDASERMVSKLITEQVKTLLADNWNVVLDNCHTRIDYIQRSIQDFSYLADIQFKLFDLPLDELYERNAKRPRKVPTKVISSMFDSLQSLKTKFDFLPIRKIQKGSWVEMPRPTPDRPACLIVDIDGTLSNSDQRHIFNFKAEEILQDRVIEQVNWLVKILSNHADLKVILCSGREEDYKDVTEKWLRNVCQLNYEALYMRPSGDYRNDAIIKEEILNNKITPYFTPLFAIDDRKRVKQMWVKNGLVVFEVNQLDLVF